MGLDKLKKSYHLTEQYKELDEKLLSWGKEGTRSHGKIGIIEEEFDSYFKKNKEKWNTKRRPRFGFNKVKELLKNKENPIYLELGAELGSSAKEILENFETVTVISVDYWPKKHISTWPELKNIIEDPNYGPYSIFSNRLFEYKDRVIPIQQYTVDGLDIVKSHDVVPDVIYIDASHTFEDCLRDIEKSYNLFPDTVLCGDDYETGEGVKQAVLEFCNRHNLLHEVFSNQWIIKGEKKDMNSNISLPKLKKIDLNKPKKKKILLLSDDMRLHSGVGTMSREIVLNSCKEYDWVQIGGAIKHPDQGKRIDISSDIQKETGVQDASVIVYPTDGYGNPDLLRQLISHEKIDIIMHFTDPRFWGWLYNMEHEIRQTMPLIYLNIWDDLPYPHWNENAYESCDLLMAISKQTYNINKNVCQRKPRVEGLDLTYLPHGICENKFFKIGPNHPEFSRYYTFREKMTNKMNLDPDFTFFFNSRNIRRKGVSNLILGYRLFCDTIGKEEAKNTCLLLHCERVDPNGTDLPAVHRALASDYNVKFTDAKFPTNELNYLYNMADVTCQPSTAEGFGLSVCESLMTGTPIIASCIGGLQDQMGFMKEDGTYLTEKDYTTDWPSNADKRYTKHGEWAFPMWPTVTLQGSPQTPYIYDSIININDIKDRMLETYKLGTKELERRGNSGREYVTDPKIKMTAKNMGTSFIEQVNNMLESWKPRERFTVINTDMEDVIYPDGIMLK